LLLQNAKRIAVFAKKRSIPLNGRCRHYGRNILRKNNLRRKVVNHSILARSLQLILSRTKSQQPEVGAGTEEGSARSLGERLRARPRWGPGKRWVLPEQRRPRRTLAPPGQHRATIVNGNFWFPAVVPGRPTLGPGLPIGLARHPVSPACRAGSSYRPPPGGLFSLPAKSCPRLPFVAQNRRRQLDRSKCEPVNSHKLQSGAVVFRIPNGFTSSSTTVG
jgi:hypothetical protein